ILLYFVLFFFQAEDGIRDDWSSDVCSSDLAAGDVHRLQFSRGEETDAAAVGCPERVRRSFRTGQTPQLIAGQVANGQDALSLVRSEERRVGKECRSRLSQSLSLEYR